MRVERVDDNVAAGGTGHYDVLSYDSIAIFWPSTKDPVDVGQAELWLPHLDFEPESLLCRSCDGPPIGWPTRPPGRPPKELDDLS